MTEPTLGSSLPTPIDCETAIRRLWDYMDGRLPITEQGEVERHLATCELCPPHFTFAAAMRDALASMRPGESAKAAEYELRDKVRRALNRHQ
jgi:anti-sigma factor RsiW